MLKKLSAVLLALAILVAAIPFTIAETSADTVDLMSDLEFTSDGAPYVMGDVLYDPDFSTFTKNELPEGWSYGYKGGSGENQTSFGWTSGGNNVRVYANTDGTTPVVQLRAEHNDVFLACPSTGTLNYIFEAEVKPAGNGSYSIGIANNFYAPTNEATGVFYNFIKRNGSTATYAYRGQGTGGEWNPSFDCSANEKIKLKIISLDGLNYVYYNDTLVATAPWRGGVDATSDNPGFCITTTSDGGSTQGMYIYDVKVTAIYTLSTEIDNTYISVAEDNSVDLSTAISVDKSQQLYTDNVNGDYNADDAAVKFGAVVLKSDNKDVNMLTASTEGAEVITAKTFSETEEKLKYTLTLDVAEEDYQKWYNIRTFAIVNGQYIYDDGVSYKPANLANSAYLNADEAGKAAIKSIFGGCDEFLYKDGVKSITFTAFADFHYKDGMYPSSIADLLSIFKRADDSNSSFVVSAGDITNDMLGSPELVNAFHGYVTEEGGLMKAYNVYGNHELESANNTMTVVTPTLTNDENVVWGTADGKMDTSIGYYYVDIDGFRLVAVDNQYSWNPTEEKWEHNWPNSYGAPAGNTKTGSLGDVQMAWLENVLMDAANNDIPCIVVGHGGYSGLGFGGGVRDAEEVRAIYKKANDANPGTVLMSINGHIHTNNQGWNEGVFYLDLNTVRNTWWQQEGSEHYTDRHTYKYEEYDEQGNLVGTYDRPLSELVGAEKTWFSADPLSAVVTLSDNGVVSIDGTESKWMYDIAPTGNLLAGSEPRITSGLFIDCETYGHALTCVDGGDYHYNKCANPKCDYVAEGTEEPHAFVENPLDKYLVSEATCEQLATYHKSCECGKASDETFTDGDYADHDFKDGACSVCERTLGDMNNDKEINILDLVAIQRIVLGLDEYNVFADLDQNEIVDAADATAIRVMLVK